MGGRGRLDLTLAGEGDQCGAPAVYVGRVGEEGRVEAGRQGARVVVASDRVVMEGGLECDQVQWSPFPCLPPSRRSVGPSAWPDCCWPPVAACPGLSTIPSRSGHTLPGVDMYVSRGKPVASNKRSNVQSRYKLSSHLGVALRQTMITL